MASLYVDSSVDEIRADGRSLTLYRDGRMAGRVPAVPLERVVIQGNVRLETRVLHMLAKAGVEVHFLSGRFGRWEASLVGREHGHGALRVAQVQTHLDPEASTVLARRWVARKLEGQLENVGAWLEFRVSNREAVASARKNLAEATRQVETSDKESLRGVEGAAARAYFKAMSAVIPNEMGFSGRNRRPPTDPVNALLSLTYTLVHSEWAHRLRLAGFDPQIGFYHAVSYGRESLASDLMEPWRPAVDRWVVALVRDGAFRRRDFADGGARAGCWLKKAARGRYYPAYEVWARDVRDAWRAEAYALANELLGGGSCDEGSVPGRE